MDKEIKKNFKKEASKNPDKYYSTGFLKKKGYVRKQCVCGTFYWSKNGQEVCGDPSCSGGFRFLKNNPAKKKLSYKNTWLEFEKHMNKNGYESIKRYSTVARWRDDTDFVQASIYNFQPYVVSGEVQPPANPLIVPQFCLRFNDVDNVGVTMSHCTGFVMIGQHAFMSPTEWDQEKYFKNLYEFFTVVIGIPEEELIMHEDAWAGGGNYGPCMEIFCKGVELANQVYMLYQRDDDGERELSIKVLDMGMGHERVAWFTQGVGTIYDAVFPNVMQKMYKRTNVHPNTEFLKKYVPLGSYLNLDEVEDINVAWKEISKKIGLSVDELKKEIETLSALYSVAEHTRSLLFAISDGALPSNVKGGYNLRVILRRALGFINKYGWDLNLGEIAEWHAEQVKGVFPEVQENLEHVKKILDVEKHKYIENHKRNRNIIEKLVGKKLSTDKLIELYDSHGITPEDVKQKNKDVKIPENFYGLVNEKHEKKSDSKVKAKYYDFKTKTNEVLYYQHFDLVNFKANVVESIKENGFSLVVLDKTAFYPTSGGQEHDTGSISGYEVVDVFKQGKLIIHKVKGDPKGLVECEVNFDRRLQLSQHHTATHILTGSTNKILGSHVWQAGAAKTVEKGRLDITHYEQITSDQLRKVEELANEIVVSNLPVNLSFMSRDKAEARYGIRIYQGGAVPGNELRIVNIEGFDVEACGGTHVNVTGDVERVKILRTSKLQDGVVRLEFVAGEAAKKLAKENHEVIKKSAELLNCGIKQVPSRAEELFKQWKKARKNKLGEFELKSEEKYSGDVLKKTAEVLKTQPEHVLKTIKRFLEDINGKEKK